MSKPTPLERIISDWHWAAEDAGSGAISVKDSLILAAAREELRVLRELATAEIAFENAPIANDRKECDTLHAAIDTYKDWLAKQGGGR